MVAGRESVAAGEEGCILACHAQRMDRGGGRRFAGHGVVPKPGLGYRRSATLPLRISEPMGSDHPRKDGAARERAAAPTSRAGARGRVLDRSTYRPDAGK